MIQEVLAQKKPTQTLAWDIVVGLRPEYSRVVQLILSKDDFNLETVRYVVSTNSAFIKQQSELLGAAPGVSTAFPKCGNLDGYHAAITATQVVWCCLRRCLVAKQSPWDRKHKPTERWHSAGPAVQPDDSQQRESCHTGFGAWKDSRTIQVTDFTESLNLRESCKRIIGVSRKQKVEETRSTGRLHEEPSLWDGRGPSIPHSVFAS